MTKEQIVERLVKARIFLRLGTDNVESLLQHQMQHRPVTVLLCVCETGKDLETNARITQGVVDNADKGIMSTQLYHSGSDSFLIVFQAPDDAVGKWVENYARKWATETNQAGYIVCRGLECVFHPTQGEPQRVGGAFTGTIEYVERLASWLVPEFTADGVIDNSMSYRQQADHRYMKTS